VALQLEGQRMRVLENDAGENIKIDHKQDERTWIGLI
jgi:hypothetical protein